MNQVRSKIFFSLVLIGIAFAMTFPVQILKDNFFNRLIFDQWTRLSQEPLLPYNGLYSIEFDQSSLFEIGYPVNRETHANLLKKISSFEPKVVAYDIIFGQSRDKAGTNQLAKSMDQSKSALILAASLDEQGQLDGPTEPIANSDRKIGIVDGQLDVDGIYRWYPLIHQTAEGYLPSLALAAYLAKNNARFEVISDQNKKIKGININNVFFDLTSDPLGAGRMALVPKSKSVDVQKYSWSEILSDDFQSPLQFLDGTFFVGLTAMGVASHQSTALDPVQSPLHNHLFVLQDLEQRKNLKPWPGQYYFYGAWVILLILLFIGLRPLRYFINASVTLFLVLALASFSFILWRMYYMWIPQAEVLTLFAGSVVAFIRKSKYEERQKLALKKSFSAYLHPSLVKDLMDHATEVRLGGEERELTLLFSDLRNFTSLSEKISSTELVSVMNEYFTIVTKHIQESGGTVDKFIGDAVMAFWNAPLTQEDHADKALDAVSKIRTDFKKFSAKWKQKLNLQEGIFLGMGLHTGKAVVGNIGGENRFNYTALGDAVNLASRLEGICKVYGVDIVVSADLLNLVRRETKRYWVEIDTIQVKGQSNDVVIFTENNLTDVEYRIWGEVLQFWRAGHLDEVKNRLTLLPENFGPALTFKRRIESMQVFPVGWTGSWKMYEK